ncbi:unnamed protein product [Merluccius merluccius]
MGKEANGVSRSRFEVSSANRVGEGDMFRTGPGGLLLKLWLRTWVGVVVLVVVVVVGVGLVGLTRRGGSDGSHHVKEVGSSVTSTSWTRYTFHGTGDLSASPRAVSSFLPAGRVAVLRPERRYEADSVLPRDGPHWMFSNSDEAVINKKLPKELLLRIFSFLDVVTLCRCAQVSRSWNVLALDGSNWQRIDLFDFQRDIEPPEGSNGPF